MEQMFAGSNRHTIKTKLTFATCAKITNRNEQNSEKASNVTKGYNIQRQHKSKNK